MNNQRRKELLQIENELEGLQGRLEDCLLDEEFSLDSIPENLRSSQRAETSEEAIDNMTSANDGLNDVIDNLREIINLIDEATI